MVNADGSGVKQLIGGGMNPSWSPDGSKILYEGFQGIWVVNADGSDAKRFIETVPNSHPTWSPDGQQIAFMDDLDEPQG
ncbi:MAG: PD40 domain-containing protein, partial [Blastocatellia bacterium]|nr:PD40 domain-containing protein [Blastocatellia bacterium]